jgi:hypothetical protein
MLKHLPEICLSSLLEIFNTIWLTGSFPSDWSEAIIIPIRIPEKDHSNPENYRQIALTSCLCKTFERMVHHRLHWYLEMNHLLSELQSGFHRGRSTTDQLVRHESFSARCLFVANIPLLCFSILRKPTIPPGNTVYFRTLKLQAFGADCQHSS